MRRSLVVCLIVGTILTVINQGNFILSGEFQPAMAWKIPMTYAVPFVVASIGSLLNARSEILTGSPK
ncbi:MAG: nitrate/nitrite transporter NrtS [Dehalococcoidia bacterium]|nr:nitrate/nitrite transporter NrtS [Dehalococcoidia bacterium]